MWTDGTNRGKRELRAVAGLTLLSAICAAALVLTAETAKANGATGAAPAAMGANPAVVADPTASAPATTASAPVVLQKAPTIRALSDLATRERIKDANERYSKLFASSAPQAQQGQPAKAEVKPSALQFAFEPPPTIRRLLAIYGPVGQEKAEVERGDGVVVTVQGGELVDNFRVLSVRAGAIDVQAVRSACAAKAARIAKAAAGKSRKDAAPCGPAPVQRVSVGGIFK